MIELSKEKCEEIQGVIDFQLLVSRATGNTNIFINNEYGEIFMSLLEEKKQEKKNESNRNRKKS